MSRGVSDWPTIRYGLLCALSLLGLAGGALLSGMGLSAGGEKPQTEELTARRGNQEIVSPRPGLTPREVVELQMQGLRDYRREPSALLQCYSLASLANRAITGPLERFKQMVLHPDYLPLIAQTGATLGQAVVRDDYATVLVTVIDQQQSLHVYRFFLSKQRDQPFAGCWMTDAVFLVELPPPLPLGAEPRDV